MGTWRFREVERGDIKQDPQEAEFFTEEGRPDALVREVIQNSLDAAADVDDQVRVRFAFRRLAPELGSEVLTTFFDEYSPHLNSQEFVESNPLEDALDYIVVEDFGTTGLLGDPAVFSDRDAGPGDSFFWFWRNVGRSGKAESDLGRWGVGKTVFPTSSRMFCYFGLSRRRDDRRTLLMGLSVMKTHAIGETEYRPYGYFGDFDDDFPMPIEDPAILEKFRTFFDLKREDEAGLSVVIPYPKQEIRPRDIQSAVVQEFFYPILENSLQVDIEAESLDGVREINHATLVERALEIDWRKQNQSEAYMFDLIDFTEAAIDSKQTPDATLSTAGTGGAPGWGDELFEDVDIEELQQRWEDGDLITVRVPVRVKPVDGKDVTSHFTAFFQRDEDLVSGDSHFVRSGLMVPDAGKPIPSGVRAMAVIDDSPLSALLGDAENPAHRRWTEASDRLKKDYEHGPFTVRFVNHSLKEICERLVTPPEGLDEELLSDVFFIEQPEKPQPPERPTTPEPEVEVPSRPKPFRIGHRRGGFRVTGARGLDDSVAGGTIRLAYDVVSGNPFSRYREWDFRVGDDIELRAERCEIEEAMGNRVRFRVSDPDFELVATGFDVRRDVIVDVTPIRQSEE